MADERPIIIKRIKKKGGHGHHGGAWKIAYADFMTAMMAFFLLMWLLSTVSEEQLAGIADVFSPPSDSIMSGSPGIFGGKILGQGGLTDQAGATYQEITEEQAREKLMQEEQKQFEQTKSSLEDTISNDPNLAGLSEHLVVDNTAEGMRIQLIDQENAAMFPSGSNVMTDTAKKLIEAVANVIKRLPQKIAIEGNTDAIPFSDPNGYTNWDLSAERALASRRKLVELGVEEGKILRVSGLADTNLFDPENPTSPNNRRISIVLLRNYLDDASDAQKLEKKKPRRDPFARFREENKSSETSE